VESSQRKLTKISEHPQTPDVKAKHAKAESKATTSHKKKKRTDPKGTFSIPLIVENEEPPLMGGSKE